ncbi:MAG: hypothetical protein NZ902_03470 [Acidilobaceae archaeon]|nr:hypothetical protein [Acidilobaceae archaeon]MCX8165211.1 hypothetical protein [Acidilobaceae archaeon]MDW7974273.1 hypothetical protein [Sulfolobales archaeon]
MRQCAARKDFLRHIVNRVLMDYAHKMPARVLEDIKERIGRGEDKYNFSVYGGDPGRIAEYLSSEEWFDLVKYVRSIGMTGVLEDILKALAEEYRECPQIASKARELVGTLGGKLEAPRLTLNQILNRLELEGLRPEVVERGEEKVVVIKDAYASLEIALSEEVISYTICKKGKSATLEAVLALYQRLREL